MLAESEYISTIVISIGKKGRINPKILWEEKVIDDEIDIIGKD